MASSDVQTRSVFPAYNNRRFCKICKFLARDAFVTMNRRAIVCTGVDPLGTGGTRPPKVRAGGTPIASSPKVQRCFLNYWASSVTSQPSH